MSAGTCFVCGDEVAHDQMGAHLETCLDEAPLSENRSLPSRGWVFGARGTGVHEDFWTFFIIPRAEQLVELDQFLRKTWLDCCGHLSAFNIGGQRFESHGGSTGPAHGKPPGSLTPKITSVLKKGDEFTYEYDFANPTQVEFHCFGQHDWPAPTKLKMDSPIAWGAGMMLAQSDMPDWECSECGADAEQICSECGLAAGATFCESCAEEHEHADQKDAMLPITNSPRAGVCRFGSKEVAPAATAAAE